MNFEDFNTCGPTADTSQPAAEFGWQATHPVSSGRTELEAFIAATRRELYALAESLEQAVQDQPAEAALAPIQPNEPVSTMPPQVEPLPVSQPAQKKPAETVAAADDDEDPLARLNAIKLRLAQQLKNTL